MKNCCTMFFKGTWNKCCCKHDKRYENKRLNRKQADILLRRCVKNNINIKNKYLNKIVKFIVPNIMYVGVRVFGWYFYKKE